MSTRSSAEFVNEIEGNNFSSAFSHSAFIYSAITFEWEEILPRFVLRMIDTRVLPEFRLSLASKLRFLEACVFFFTLAYALFYIS